MQDLDTSVLKPLRSRARERRVRSSQTFTEEEQVCELFVLCCSAPPWDPALELLWESEPEAGL